MRVDNVRDVVADVKVVGCHAVPCNPIFNLDAAVAIRSLLSSDKVSAMRARAVNLVIDSHDLDIQRLIVLLKDHGCYVSHVKNGAQGLEFLSKSSDVKLIFTELGLQLMGGIEFLKRLRSSDNKDLPVVIYSSDASKEHIVEAKKQKIMGWLMKPVSKIKLDEIMKMVATTQKKLAR